MTHRSSNTGCIGRCKRIEMRIAVTEQLIEHHDAFEIVAYGQLIGDADAAVHLHRLVSDLASGKEAVCDCAADGAAGTWDQRCGVVLRCT